MNGKEDIMKTGEKLKQYAKQRGIRLRWIADKMNITPPAIYYKVNGTTPITIEDALRIKKYCRMNEMEFASIFKDEEWFGLIR